MNDQRKILESIVKYAAISTLAIFTLRYGLRFFLGKEIFTPSGIRILLMGCSFVLLRINRKRIVFNSLSILTILTVYFGLVVYPLYGFPINVGGFIIFLVSTIMTTIIPIAIYHPFEQRKEIIAWNLLIVVTFFFVVSQSGKFLNSSTFESLTFLMTKELMLGFAFFGTYLAIGWIIYQYQLTNYRAQIQTEQINKEILESNRISKTQADKLQEKKIALDDASKRLLKAKAELEKKVKKETKKVDEKTKLLLKLSFINSHYLRVPIARIQSVLQVWNIVGVKEKRLIIKNSIDELNTIIDAIVKINDQNMDVHSAEKYIEKIQLNQTGNQK